MQQKIEGGTIFVRASREEEAVIKTWRMMKKDKEKGYWYGQISRALLENLKRNGGLIPPAKKILDEMLMVQAAVDAERIRPDPEVHCYRKPPVKADLFRHQQRAYNMALMVFGLVDPKEALNG